MSSSSEGADAPTHRRKVDIPFLDLSYQTREIQAEYLDEVRRITEACEFIGGGRVREFEQAFAAFCGAPHCVALNSGTDGLRLALTACGIGPQDEVITTPFTFIATTEAISQTGCLMLADIDPETFNLSPQAVAERVTPRTRALVPVHVFGVPAAMRELAEVACRRDLVLVEDACQAHGAEIAGQRAGTFGSCASFSFYPTKNIGAFGDAGALTCLHDEIAGRIRLLANHGQVGAYAHEVEGFNSRLDVMQAAVLSLKLRHLEDWNRRRRELAAIYRSVLEATAEVRFQKVLPGVRPVYHLLAARVERRDDLMRYLSERNIETRIIYPTPIHLLQAYASRGFRSGEFPNAEALCREVLCFPLYPGLEDSQVEQVAGTVRRFYVG